MAPPPDLRARLIPTERSQPESVAFCPRIRPAEESLHFPMEFYAASH